MAAIGLGARGASAQILAGDEGSELAAESASIEPAAPIEPVVNVMNCVLRYGPNPSPKARRCTAKLLMGDGSLRIVSCLIAAGSPSCTAQAPMPMGVRILRAIPAQLAGPGEEERGCMYMTDGPVAMIAPPMPGTPPVNVVHQFMCVPPPLPPA